MIDVGTTYRILESPNGYKVNAEDGWRLAAVTVFVPDDPAGREGLVEEFRTLVEELPLAGGSR